MINRPARTARCRAELSGFCGETIDGERLKARAATTAVLNTIVTPSEAPEAVIIRTRAGLCAFLAFCAGAGPNRTNLPRAGPLPVRDPTGRSIVPLFPSLPRRRNPI